MDGSAVNRRIVIHDEVVRGRFGMGLFNRRQARADADAEQTIYQARSYLSDLYVSRGLRNSSKQSRDWRFARTTLDRYRREAKAIDSANVEPWLKHLEVQEPRPALEDFLPDDMAAALAQPTLVIAEAQRRLEADRDAYAQREKRRREELRAARSMWDQRLASLAEDEKRYLERRQKQRAALKVRQEKEREARQAERRQQLLARQAENQRKLLAKQAERHEQLEGKEAERQKQMEAEKAQRRERRKAEKAEALKRQLEAWPEEVKLDKKVTAILGISAQVTAQNEKIEQQIRALNSLLTAGLAAPTLTNADLVCGMASGDSEVWGPSTAEDIECALAAINLPIEIKPKLRVSYTAQSRQAIVEYELPDVTVVPNVKFFRYIKSRDQVVATARPIAQVKSLYADGISQLALLCLAHIFAADNHGVVDVVVFNGVVETLDPRIGQPIRPCLISVRVTRQRFAELNLNHVDPRACLKHLSASVSTSPTELAPVKPVLEFSMVDPRFITETDAMSVLDTRPNLMDLTPSEFEALISNLFTRMGLEARQTCASRDGGVDCVAWDTRPIFGGKVVIQAKRYKNTVGVSAVRDLFGTLQNEGASKGILVTTSGYGAASFDFAQNKPIELIDGANLLYLLEEHTGVIARIEPPDDWRDPTTDGGDAA